MNGKTSDIRGKKAGRRLVVSISLLAIILASAFVVNGTRSGFTLRLAPTFTPSARVVIAVDGMYCDSCAAGIKSMLKRTPDVIAAEVSYKEKQAVVDYDSEKTTPEKIVAVINNLGYKAKIKS